MFICLYVDGFSNISLRFEASHLFAIGHASWEYWIYYPIATLKLELNIAWFFIDWWKIKWNLCGFNEIYEDGDNMACVLYVWMWWIWCMIIFVWTKHEINDNTHTHTYISPNSLLFQAYLIGWYPNRRWCLEEQSHDGTMRSSSQHSLLSCFKR